MPGDGSNIVAMHYTTTKTAVYHFWHGEMRDRGYPTRQSILQRFDFDPNRDIALDDNGCWRWNSDKPDLHDAVRAYFQDRKEDGR